MSRPDDEGSATLKAVLVVIAVFLLAVVAFADDAKAAGIPERQRLSCKEAAVFGDIVMQARAEGVNAEDVLAEFGRQGYGRESYIVRAVYRQPGDAPPALVLREVVRACQRNGEAPDA